MHITDGRPFPRSVALAIDAPLFSLSGDPKMKYLLPALAAALLMGCGARTEVMKDKVVAKIDNMLGELDVKKKEVELSMAEMENAKKDLQKGRIKVEVKAEQLGDNATELENKIGALDASLKKLRDLLATGEDAEIAGKTYTQAELNDMAKKLITQRGSYEKQMDSLKKSQTMLESRAAKIDEMVKSYSAQLDKLKTKISEIDANMVALKAMQETSGVGGEDQTLAQSFGELEDKVDDLYASLETELRMEEAMFDEASLDEDISSVDEFIQATQGAGDTLSEIDKILGTE
jgi:chromosome segregation ATPase